MSTSMYNYRLPKDSCWVASEDTLSKVFFDTTLNST